MAIEKVATRTTPPSLPPTVRDKLFAWLYVTVASHEAVGTAVDVPTAVKTIAAALQGQVSLNPNDMTKGTLYPMIINWVTHMKAVQGLQDPYVAVNGNLTSTQWGEAPPHPSIGELNSAFRS